MSATEPNPVLIDVTRGPLVESRHRGAIAVVNSAGELLESWGDIEIPVYPRSAIKLLQAIPLLETGAADRYKVGAQELALACASHTGTEAHVNVARDWLRRLGLRENALVCGAHEPLDPAAVRALAHEGRRPGPLHNNCSGKHLGMLTTAIARGEPPQGYADPGHPVQARIRAVLAEMSGVDVDQAPAATDGCGVPTIAMPLLALARAFAKVADMGALPTVRSSAVRRLSVAVAMQPDFAGGHGRLSSAMIRRKGRSIYVKEGAEGVWCAALMEYRIGIALKIDDGAKRAADAALLTLFEGLGFLGEEDLKALRALVPMQLRNHAGEAVGEIRPAPGWPG